MPSASRSKAFSPPERTVGHAESPVLNKDTGKEARRPRSPDKLVQLLKNPLTLILLTWLIMAVLLWLEIVSR